MFSFRNYFLLFVQEVNKPSPHLVTVLEFNGYVFSDLTISEGLSSLFI